MTYSGDRPGPLEGQMSGPAASELSPEDLERLATEFRPSWELDEAPFTGAAHFSAADMQTLQPGEAAHRIRRTLVTTTDEGFLSGRPNRISSHPPAPQAARAPNRPPGPSRSSPPPAFALAPMRAPALSLDSSLEARQFRRRPSWISFAFVGVLLIAVGVWATSSINASQAGTATGGAAHEASAVVPAPEPPKETQAAPPPAPPPEPVAATAEATPPPKPVAATAEATPPPKPVAEAHSVPQATPVIPAPTPAPVRATQAASAPARAQGSAKPATHPKSSGPTIVRDVPF